MSDPIPCCTCRAASTAEIKRAYKKLALAYHPDKHKAEDAEQQASGERSCCLLWGMWEREGPRERPEAAGMPCIGAP